MAVQQWELVTRERRPALELVETAPAPPRGKPGLAIAFVLFVALAVGTPSIAAGIEGRPEVQRWVPRPQPATALSVIDPVGPVPKGARPTSGGPFAGILFVRCTRMWAALPGFPARRHAAGHPVRTRHPGAAGLSSP